MPNVSGSSLRHNNSIVSTCSDEGNIANVEATMCGNVSSKSNSINGTNHPITAKIDSPNAKMKRKTVC